MAEGQLLKPLAVSLGDPAGIGPVLLRMTRDSLPPVEVFAAPGDPVKPGHPSKESGRQALASFRQAARAVQEGRCSALVTLPLSKEHVALSEPAFRGHTEELGRLWGGDPLMVLEGGTLRVALVTTHLRLAEVPVALTRQLVVSRGRILRDALKRRMTQWREPRLHLLALNPHAGEGGLLGDEEQRILLPALKDLRDDGGDWQGPHPADGFFARGDFGDAVLAPYHDQGLVAVKLLAKRSGVNVTLGLPFIRTSPDHGTAFDLARSGGTPDTASFLAAVRRATELQATRL
ncbi:MAG: PdxA family protein [Planctomycetota bacterium]